MTINAATTGPMINSIRMDFFFAIGGLGNGAKGGLGDGGLAGTNVDLCTFMKDVEL